MKTNILIISHCSTNKGDRAVLEFLLNNIPSDFNITVSASDPSLWNLDNVKFINNSLKKIFKNKIFYILIYKYILWPLLINLIIKGKKNRYIKYLLDKDFFESLSAADIVISTGGHHLTDINTRDGKKVEIYDHLLANYFDKNLYLWSQSIGPFNKMNKKSIQALRKMLEETKGIYIRDNNSYDHLSSLCLSSSGNIYKTDESVLGLNYKKNLYKNNNKIIGISLYTGKKKSDVNYQDYLNTFIQFVNIYSKKDYNFYFFSMELKNGDYEYIKTIIDNVDSNKCKIIDSKLSLEEHFDIMQNCTFYIGHKTHSVVFSLLLNIPIIAIAYHEKTIDFMKDYDLLDYCINDNDLNIDKLCMVSEKLLDNIEDIIIKQEKITQIKSINVKDALNNILCNEINN